MKGRNPFLFGCCLFCKPLSKFSPIKLSLWRKFSAQFCSSVLAGSSQPCFSLESANTDFFLEISCLWVMIFTSQCNWDPPPNVNAVGTMERRMQDNMPREEKGSHRCDGPPFFKYPILCRLLITHRSRARLGSLGDGPPELAPASS